jgi:hypothetical protein
MDPVGQLAMIEPSRSEIEDSALLPIGGGIDFAAVQEEEGLHRRVPDALVAIDERVPLNQGQTQRRGLFSERGIQVTTIEGDLGLSDCGFQRPEIPDAGRAASRSATAALARSSGLRPRRSTSWRRRSAWAGDRSMVTFMRALYRVAGPSNNMVERTGAGRPAAHHELYAARR